MTRRPKVWEPRAGTSGGEEMPEWEVGWIEPGDTPAWLRLISHPNIRAPHAWDAWLQVKGAPAFGSCRVRRME